MQFALLIFGLLRSAGAFNARRNSPLYSLQTTLKRVGAFLLIVAAVVGALLTHFSAGWREQLRGSNCPKFELLEFACERWRCRRFPYTRLICDSSGTLITRAPKGHLDEMIHHAPAIAQINSAWNQRVIQDMTSRFEQMQEASNRQFQQMTEHYAKANQDLIARGRQEDNVRAEGTRKAIMIDRDAQAATDHAARRTVQYSLDRQTFINPSTGEKIEASNQYNHQWMSSDGDTLIQTQDHTLDPNGVVYPVSQSWVELIPSN